MHQAHAQHLSSLQGELGLYFVPPEGFTWCTEGKSYLIAVGSSPKESKSSPFRWTRIPACLFVELKPFSHF